MLLSFYSSHISWQAAFHLQMHLVELLVERLHNGRGRSDFLISGGFLNWLIKKTKQKQHRKKNLELYILVKRVLHIETFGQCAPLRYP